MTLFSYFYVIKSMIQKSFMITSFVDQKKSSKMEHKVVTLLREISIRVPNSESTGINRKIQQEQKITYKLMISIG